MSVNRSKYFNRKMFHWYYMDSDVCDSLKNLHYIVYILPMDMDNIKWWLDIYKILDK